jgi:UDP-GlcNAc3NAcA epimerase
MDIQKMICMEVLSIVGARPQFIKAASVIRAIKKNNINNQLKIQHILVHTGQHYDKNMSRIFFDELDMPRPEYNLEVGSGTHGEQTAKMMQRIETVLIKERPNMTIVYGDTNSTLAGALTTVKHHIPVAHVEAGLRSYNKRMPEEINRVITDHISDLLFCPTGNAVNNLRREGFINVMKSGHDLKDNFSLSQSTSQPLVINVGDVMFDSISNYAKLADVRSDILAKLDLKKDEYVLVTVHRAENTDNKERLRAIFEALKKINKYISIILPLHPRTRKAIKESRIDVSGLKVTEPVSYLDMICLEKNAKVICTDSGGMQKEAYFCRVPCITLRDETEWKETLESGWNRLVDAEPDRIQTFIEEVISDSWDTKPQVNQFGDGKAAEKIYKVISSVLEKSAK